MHIILFQGEKKTMVKGVKKSPQSSKNLGRRHPDSGVIDCLFFHLQCTTIVNFYLFPSEKRKKKSLSR